MSFPWERWPLTMPWLPSMCLAMLLCGIGSQYVIKKVMKVLSKAGSRSLAEDGLKECSIDQKRWKCVMKHRHLLQSMGPANLNHLWGRSEISGRSGLRIGWRGRAWLLFKRVWWKGKEGPLCWYISYLYILSLNSSVVWKSTIFRLFLSYGITYNIMLCAASPSSILSFTQSSRISKPSN